MELSLTNKAERHLQHVLDSVDGKRAWLMRRLGNYGAKALRAHFKSREQEPNAKGWPKQHFWEDVHNSTAFVSADNDSATVAVNSRALRHKITGGTVRPRNARALAIPLRAEAYGKMPSSGEIPGLFVLRSRIAGKAFLARKDGEKLTLYYVLLKSVTHRPDPRAMPNMTTLYTRLADEASRLISEKLKD